MAILTRLVFVTVGEVRSACLSIPKPTLQMNLMEESPAYEGNSYWTVDKKLPALCGTQKCMTMITNPCQSLARAK